MMRGTQRKPAKAALPLRVRHEPATIEDAVHAARGLTSELEQQVEIVAGLTRMTPDEVREHVLRQPAEPSPRGPAVVVVERRRARISSPTAAGSATSPTLSAYRGR